MKPYYEADGIRLFHGDCREVTEWLAAEVLVTDPPYGIGWKRGEHKARASKAHSGIQGDSDTTLRDLTLVMWGGKPAMVFGSFWAAYPSAWRHILVFRKPADSGAVGSTMGWRRDLEPIFLTGGWPQRPVSQSSLVGTAARNSGNPSGLAARYGHPHAKPVDVMEQLIAACPPGVIADPFAGSGSTLIAARNQGREAIGVEIEERYCELAAKRLQQGSLFTGEAS